MHNLALLLRQRDDGVRRGGCRAVKLSSALAVLVRCDLICKSLRLIHEVACCWWADWNVAGLLLVIWRGVHGVAPWLVLRPIGVPAIVVVAETVGSRRRGV